MLPFSAYNYVFLCTFIQSIVGLEDPAKETGLAKMPRRNKKQAKPDIEFTKALDLDNDTCSILAPPKNPRTLSLPANREPCKTTLPEDCHYQPEDLVKLFLLPNVMVKLQDFECCLINYIICCI